MDAYSNREPSTSLHNPRPRKRESKLQHPLAGNISNEKHESTVGHICAEPEFATPPTDKEIVNNLTNLQKLFNYNQVH